MTVKIPKIFLNISGSIGIEYSDETDAKIVKIRLIYNADHIST